MRNPNRRWTDAENLTLLERRALGEGHAAIGRFLGRTMESVRAQYHRLQDAPFRAMRLDGFQKPAPKPQPSMLADRERRALLDHRDLTGFICGDPKPGYSALDQREGR